MQDKTSRALRRHHRARIVRHAFLLHWDKWNYREDTYAYRYYGYEKVYLESEEARRQYQDARRKEALKDAVRIADNLAHCTCQVCQGWWKDYELRPKQLKELLRDEDDYLELLDCENLEEGKRIKL